MENERRFCFIQRTHTRKANSRMSRAVAQPIDEQGDHAPRTVGILVVILHGQIRDCIQQVVCIDIGAHFACGDHCVQQSPKRWQESPKEKTYAGTSPRQKPPTVPPYLQNSL